MGNCQAAEAATVVIQHPPCPSSTNNNNMITKIERIYWSVSAHEVMSSNPGHYIAQVVTSPTLKAHNGLPIKHLKLLRPDDTLLIGHVYRLVTFEDVLKEFAAKKCVKLGKLLKDRGAIGVVVRRKDSDLNPNPKMNPAPRTEKCSSVRAEQEEHNHRLGSNGGSTSSGSSYRGVGRHHGGGGRGGGGGGCGGGQWKPALQSISELGT